jgi:hypothetical protein
VISPALFAMMVLMALVTTFMTVAAAGVDLSGADDPAGWGGNGGTAVSHRAAEGYGKNSGGVLLSLVVPSVASV